MNIKYTIRLLLCLCLPMNAWAFDLGNGLYVAGFGGIAGVPNNIKKDQFSQARYKAGFDAGGALGYQSGSFRYEVDVNYIRAQVNNFKFQGSEVSNPSGYSHALAFMANINHDFYIMQPVVAPFLGFGIGFARVGAKLDGDHVSSFRPNGEFKIAFQGNAGLRVNLTKRFAANLSYRYFITTRSDQLGRSFQAHLGNIGLSYRFFDVPDLAIN